MPNVWEPLTHEKIFEAVEQTGGTRISNLLLQRNSYINRVYELEQYDSRERFIVKFYRPGRWTKEQILEEHQFLADLKAVEVPVVPPLCFHNTTLFQLGPIPYTLFPKKSGRALDEFNKEAWEEIGRLLARVHMVGQSHTHSSRITWRPSIATQHHLETIIKSTFLLPDFESSFKSAAENFIKFADPLFADQAQILLHGDCHKSNLIHRPNEGIYLVDFDDCCFGPPVQDLWLLLPDVPEKCEQEIAWLTKGYETFRSLSPNPYSLTPALRGMRLIHFAAWLATQSADPDFARHFPHAGTRKYWNELIKDLQAINDII